MAPPDRFALTKERVAAVLEEAIKADGLRGAPFVDAVVSAIRDGSPPVVAASGSLSSVDDKAEKKAADLLDPEEKSTLDLSMRIFLDSVLTKAKASKLSAEEAGVVELLDRSIELAGANAADWNTPFALIEDLFDLLLISELESIFPLIECRGDALAKLMGGDPISRGRPLPERVHSHARAACIPCRWKAAALPWTQPHAHQALAPTCRRSSLELSARQAHIHPYVQRAAAPAVKVNEHQLLRARPHADGIHVAALGEVRGEPEGAARAQPPAAGAGRRT